MCIAIRKKGTELFLVGHRTGYTKNSGWQFPQGGIEPQGEFLEEMKRELREEIGTDSIQVIAISSRQYRYTFPPEYTARHPGFIGQKQRWVLAEYAGKGTHFKGTQEPSEFDGFQWKKAERILSDIVDFKKGVYIKAMKNLGILSSLTSLAKDTCGA